MTSSASARSRSAPSAAAICTQPISAAVRWRRRISVQDIGRLFFAVGNATSFLDLLNNLRAVAAFAATHGRLHAHAARSCSRRSDPKRRRPRMNRGIMTPTMTAPHMCSCGQGRRRCFNTGGGPLLRRWRRRSVLRWLSLLMRTHDLNCRNRPNRSNAAPINHLGDLNLEQITRDLLQTSAFSRSQVALSIRVARLTQYFMPS